MKKIAWFFSHKPMRINNIDLENNYIRYISTIIQIMFTNLLIYLQEV